MTDLPPLRSLFAVASLVGAVACGGNAPPTLEDIRPQRAVADVELVVPMQAADPDGDALTWTVSAMDPALAARVSIEPRADGRALLRWTPQVSDVGLQAFSVTVSDGEAEATTPLAVEVTGSAEGTGPVFVQPLGTGATLDLSKQSCLSFAVEVSDPDSAEVDLALADAGLPGAELGQNSATTGEFAWCPTKDQVAGQDRYSITLIADDRVNEPTRKEFLLVLRSGTGEGCPGEPPAIVHEPEDVTSLADVVVEARVTDDVGMKYEPLLYFSDSPPGAPPDIGAMTQLTMSLVEGDDRDGLWSASIPNPVASEPAGSTAQLYYVVVAQDDDDATGACDHITQAPADDAFTMTVENPGGSGGQGICSPCSADAQCGDADDLCVFLDGAYHCFEGCSASSTCPTETYCSFGEFPSIDGATGRQCIPNDFECDGSTNPTGCTDDGFEDNDTFATAASLPLGDQSSLTSCPDPNGGDDEDYYAIQLTDSEQFSATITGGNTTDLDLQLLDDNGTQIDVSTSLTSTETVSGCLPAGTYILRVYAYGEGENDYSLTMSATPSSCTTSCVDDGNEDDDDALSARPVDLNVGPYTATTQAICGGDEDWFATDMFAGETLHATLTFLQSSPSEDLDLYVYDDNGVNLTGCSEATPAGCDPLNGQSGTSDEVLAWPIPATGTYYVVVHGWFDAENLYDICISWNASACP